MVQTLMLFGENQWDADLVNDIFEERDANLILSISLRNSDTDSWYWNREKLGQYSVRSAYSMIQAYKGSNHTSDNSGFWRKLWNLKVPPKVKSLLWRASTGCLPTKTQLRLKKVDVNVLCPVCNEDPESIYHILVSCRFARACWNTAGNWNGVLNQQNFIDWLVEIFKNHHKKEINDIVMLLWSLWKSRNDLVWNQRSMGITEIVESAKSVLDHWQSAQDKTYDNFLGFMTKEDGTECWKLPSEGKIKVNKDTAIFSDSKCYSFSMVARNHNGELVEAKSKCKQGNINPQVAEVMGVREALSWVKSHDWPVVEVETDCLLIVQAIKCASVKFSYLGRIIDECKQLLSEFKDQAVSLKFIKRSANKVAHYVTRYSCSVTDRSWQKDNVHSDILHVLLNDLKL